MKKINYSHTTWTPSPEGLIPLGLGGSIPHSPGGLKEYTCFFPITFIEIQHSGICYKILDIGVVIFRDIEVFNAVSL